MPGSPFSPGLIESTILVDAVRKFAPGVLFVNDAVAAGWAATSVTCQMELIVGCRNLTELAEIKKFFAPIRIHDLSATVGQTALSLVEQFRLSHNLLIL